MKTNIILFFLLVLFCSCEEHYGTNEPHHENFEKRTVHSTLLDSLESGKTYLSVYSQIYSLSEHKTHNLTVTASIRNIGLKDTVYITKAEYYDTHAKPIHTYFDKPIYVAPLETVEIVIDDVGQTGVAGANFIFDWKIKMTSTEPLFEGVMISTYGSKGLSFTTQGKRIE
ncbi:DUF3124 domain-containing protein [Maribacter arenosus]|uniref:DUF3124 domain-containing protein n=1 Tax=Maribacter arenosus TaxID=1854708 RepID=A0ABR7VEY1_9FLAO|nr:DUF3124 domain-containing protein [Maribacter arenosus]MBD0852206.1 DUF3124 domain-containing protein [Maribacter arenosus]